MFDVIARPTLPSLSEAPIIAMDLGDRKIDSLNYNEMVSNVFV